ncbi:hypothetical protein BPC006_II1095 [Burkholderia pseudomallei BPC006]|nr:hypothetical protein BPC006_II1095 [Burkholderia pseudomallei BPC006]
MGMRSVAFAGSLIRRYGGLAIQRFNGSAGQ